MHDCQYGRVTPKTNAEFWQTKRIGNVERDTASLKKLTEMGWDVMIIWECETRNMDQLIERICSFLGPSNSTKAAIQCKQSPFKSP
jgi:DNA mismatch endonuclease, patch repair protein